MPFVKPALASPFPGLLPEGLWYAEEKYDGHRLIVDVNCGAVTAWSRAEKERTLPAHLEAALLHFPAGVYDGELVAGEGERSYGVTELTKQTQLRFVVFDFLRSIEEDLLAYPLQERRGKLEEVYDDATGGDGTECVLLSWMTPVFTTDQAFSLAAEVWDRDGEGLVLKQPQSIYRPGKRMKEWVKLKQLHSEVMTIVGFEEGLKGPHSIIQVADDAGVQTAVKWKDYETLARIEADPQSFLGRRVRIDYHERTPDGLYRHPRWDRLEDE